MKVKFQSSSLAGPLIGLISWFYLITVSALWLFLATDADRWWPATILLFGPRWLAALPAVILLLLASWLSRRSVLPLLLGILVVLGPLMGFNIPRIRWSADNAVKAIRVITCNIDNGNCSKKALSALIRDKNADIVALQEFPAGFDLSLPSGWHLVQDKGLAIMSRFPIRRGMTSLVYKESIPWPSTCLIHCFINTPSGNVNFCSLQLPSSRPGLLPVLDRRTILRPTRNGKLLKETEYRRRASREVERTVSALSGHTIIVGDFNMPVQSSIYREIWSLYENAFTVSGTGYGWTQRAKFKRLAASIGIRIDHILTGKGIVTRLCEVGPDIGSDHLPLIADVELLPVVKTPSH